MLFMHLIFFFNISISVFIYLFIICFLATSDYKQSLQFQTLNEEKQNIHLEVCISRSLFPLASLLTSLLRFDVGFVGLGDQGW